MFRNCSEINIMNITSTTYYSNMFSNTLTDPDAYVIIGYTTDTQSIAEVMKNICYNSSKITLKQI